MEKPVVDQLTNTENFYLERAEEVSVLAKAEKYEECHRLCRQWLTYADLPLFIRGSFLLILASGFSTDDERMHFAEEALGHFVQLCKEFPEQTDMIYFRSHAQNVLNKAIALKALYEKEGAERSNEWTDEETISWLLERAAIESGERSPRDSLREVQIALASGQFPGMGTDVDPNREIRVKTLKPEERATLYRGRFADPKPLGSARLKQYGKQKPRQSIIDKKWSQLVEADKAAELAINTEKAKQEAIDKLTKGLGGSYVYKEEDGKMGELPPPQYNIEDEGIVTSSRRIKPTNTFSRELATKLSTLVERLNFWGTGDDVVGDKGLPTPAMSQGGDLSEKILESSSAVDTPAQYNTPISPRTPMHHQDRSTPLSRTPLTYRRKPSKGNLKKHAVSEEGDLTARRTPSDGNLKKRAAKEDEDEEQMGSMIKRVKSKG